MPQASASRATRPKDSLCEGTATRSAAVYQSLRRSGAAGGSKVTGGCPSTVLGCAFRRWRAWPSWRRGWLWPRRRWRSSPLPPPRWLRSLLGRCSRRRSPLPPTPLCSRQMRRLQSHGLGSGWGGLPRHSVRWQEPKSSVQLCAAYYHQLLLFIGVGGTSRSRWARRRRCEQRRASLQGLPRRALRAAVGTVRGWQRARGRK